MSDHPFHDPVAAGDRGFLLADGVFDTLAVRDGRPQLLGAHVERLVRHADIIGITAAPEAVRAAIKSVLAGSEAADLILRTTVSRGVATRGLWPKKDAGDPTIRCQLSILDRIMIGAPAKVMISAIRRNQTSPTSRIKSIAYLDHVLAAREAALAGMDEALFLNTDGQIACATTGNVFIIEGSRLVTPPLHHGAMDGVIRALLLAFPPRGHSSTEEPVTEARALAADGLFITNSIRLARPAVLLGPRVFAELPAFPALLSHLAHSAAASARIEVA